MGFGEAILLVVTPSIIAIEFKDNQTLYMGYFETAVGTGLFAGPCISTLIFRWFGYVGTLLFFAAFIGVFCISMAVMLPRRLNRSNNSTNLSQESAREVSYG